MLLVLDRNDVQSGKLLIETDGPLTVRREVAEREDFFCAEPITNLLCSETNSERTITKPLCPEKPLPDRLNLSFSGLAIFESGGRTSGATRLSDTEYQFVAALDFAGHTGLPINDLCELVVAWSDGADESTLRTIKWRVENRFEEGKIPYRIRSEQFDISEKGRTLTKKIFYLERSNA